MRSPIFYFLVFCFLMVGSVYAADSDQAVGGVTAQASIAEAAPSPVPSMPLPSQEGPQVESEMDTDSSTDGFYVNLRDPFKRPATLVIQQKETKVLAKTFLESFQLSEIKVVGIFTWPNNARAMVLDPQGGSHFVKKGTNIGTHEGEVIEILDDRVRVREKLPNALGKLEESVMEMFIQSEYKNKLSQDQNAGLSSGTH